MGKVEVEGWEFALGWIFMMEPLRLELGRPKASDLAPPNGRAPAQEAKPTRREGTVRARGKRSSAQLRTAEIHGFANPIRLSSSAFISSRRCPQPLRCAA